MDPQKGGIGRRHGRRVELGCVGGRWRWDTVGKVIQANRHRQFAKEWKTLRSENNGPAERWEPSDAMQAKQDRSRAAWRSEANGTRKVVRVQRGGPMLALPKRVQVEGTCKNRSARAASNRILASCAMLAREYHNRHAFVQRSARQTKKHGQPSNGPVRQVTMQELPLTSRRAAVLLVTLLGCSQARRCDDGFRIDSVCPCPGSGKHLVSHATNKRMETECLQKIATLRKLAIKRVYDEQVAYSSHLV